MSVLNVALLQMASAGVDQAANLVKGDAFCRRAAAMGADIALFPEMWNVGYTSNRPDDQADLWRIAARWHPAEAATPYSIAEDGRWRGLAVDRDGPFVEHFRALASELGMAIAVTYIERWPGAPGNTVSLIDRHGEVALTYAKVHTCDFCAHEATLTSGEGFHVCALDTRHGAVAIGAMICYDREFPESARILMLKGAEIVLTPNACPLEANRLGQFRARALENMVGVAMTNYAAPEQNGHSVAYDPIGFDADGRGRDTLIVEAGEGEAIVLAPFDLAALRAYRERETWGNAFRRPHRYGALTETAIGPTFARVDAHGTAYDPAAR